jgi:hypothetical protein
MKFQIKTESRLLLAAIVLGALGLGGCGAVDPSLDGTEVEVEAAPEVETAEGALAARCNRTQISIGNIVGIVDRTLTPPACCLGLNITVNNSGPTCSSALVWRVIKPGQGEVENGVITLRDWPRVSFPEVFFKFRRTKPLTADVAVGSDRKVIDL